MANLGEQSFSRTFNPLVQGSNPWGATREEPRNQAKNDCCAICVLWASPSIDDNR